MLEEGTYVGGRATVKNTQTLHVFPSPSLYGAPIGPEFLLDMDSSLSARKELAEELNYTGDVKDSAKLNVWLHKEVLKKIASNGGKVPADLLD